MREGRAEGPSAKGDRGQAVISLMPDIDGMHVCIFESLQLEGSYVGGVLNLFFFFRLYGFCCNYSTLILWSERHYVNEMSVAVFQ